jgi:hypothetical protein
VIARYQPVGEHLASLDGSHNPDATARGMLASIEAVHSFADIVDSVLRVWVRHESITSVDAERGGEA